MRRSSVLVLLLAGCTPDSELTRLFEAPQIRINNPEPGEIIRRGDGPVLFTGDVQDEFDPPEDLSLEWVLDQSTPTGASADTEGYVELSLDVDSLELGTHLIQLYATDTDGETARAGVEWELAGPLSAPMVEITAPDDGSFFAIGEEIAFRGIASDEATPADELDFAWRSSVDGGLSGALSGDGESALFTDALSEGTHTITLEVTDADGDTGADSIEVSIGDGPVEPEPGDLVFSELMINPQVVADEEGEWVELYNTASYAIDIGGYSFHDLDYDMEVLEGPLLVPGKGYIVLCANTDPAQNGGVPCDGSFKRQAADALALGNGSDEVYLSRPDEVVIDELHYTTDWFEPAIAIGLSPEYLEDGNNDSITKWCNQTTVISTGGEPGTPGRENDPC